MAPAGASRLARGFVASVAVIGGGAEVSCWVGGFSKEYCCDPALGPKGNPACWDDVFHYDPCCIRPDPPEDAGDGAALGASAAQLAGEILEASIGPKLDQSLASNEGATLESVERDMREAIESPEHRQMTETAARAYLALALHRQGRHEEAVTEFERAGSHDFSITESGAWVGTSAAGYHMHDTGFAQELARLLHESGARSVLDFGCGLGLYVRDLRLAGFRAGGFDGNPNTAEITEGRCHQADFTNNLDFGTRWDWVLSLEVAEHIPRAFEGTFVRNLDRHAVAGLVVSWGNQAGEGHVNCRSRAEAEEIFSTLGYRSREDKAELLRESSRLPWLQNTVMVFERTKPVEDGAEIL